MFAEIPEGSNSGVPLFFQTREQFEAWKLAHL